MNAMASHVTTTIPPVVAALLLVAQPATGQLKEKGIEALATSLTNANVDLSNTNLLFDYGGPPPADVAKSWSLTDAAKGTAYLVVGIPSAAGKATQVGTETEWTCGLRLLGKLANVKGKVAVPSRQGGYQTALGTWNAILPELTEQKSNACVYKPKAPKAEA